MNTLKFREILRSNVPFLEKVKKVYRIELTHFTEESLCEFSFLSIIYENEVFKKERFCIEDEIPTVRYLTSEDENKYIHTFELEDLKVDILKVFELIHEMSDNVSSISIEKIDIQNELAVAYIVKREDETLLIIDAQTGVPIPYLSNNFKSIQGYDMGYIFSKGTISRRLKLLSPSMVAFDNDEEVKSDEFYTTTTVPRLREIAKNTLLDYQVIVNLKDSAIGVPYQYEGMPPYIMNLNPVVESENIKVSDIVNSIFNGNGETQLRKSYYYYFYKPYLNQYKYRLC